MEIGRTTHIFVVLETRCLNQLNPKTND